jgi:LmbE family N-acetylglucosaminyl deacetylase
MLSLFPKDLGTILCLGAHCDDIEIGCGGTVLHLSREYPNLKVVWVVFSSDPVRAAEARNCASKLLSSVREKNIVIKEFRNGFFPYSGAQIKEYFEQLKTEVAPDLIFTHYRDDLHQDHRMLSELTWNSFRDHFVLEYEIPKYDGDLGAPNFFVPLSDEICRRKIDTIMESFVSQRDKRWFTADLFAALMRLRGMECNAPDGHAEAFYCRKAVVWR